MEMNFWIAGTLAGGVGGAAAGVLGDGIFDGFIFGAVTAAVVSLAGGHVFRLGDSDSSSAFLVTCPICGFLGGLFSAVSGDAGFFGAFLGCGIGTAAGLFIPVAMNLKS